MKIGSVICYAWAVGIIFFGFATFVACPSMGQEYWMTGVATGIVAVLLGTLLLVFCFAKKPPLPKNSEPGLGCTGSNAKTGEND